MAEETEMGLAVEETTPASYPGVEAQEPTEAVEEPEAEPEQPPEEPEAPAEAATEQLPSQVTKLARELAQERPELANTIRHMRDKFFAAQQYEKTVGSIDKARETKALLESIGGEDGISELQTAADDLRTLDEGFASGDPEIINTLAQQSPEGFKKLVPAALAALSRIDPQAYEDTIRPPLVRTLIDLADHLKDIDAWLNENQPAFARRKLGGVLKWIEGQAAQSSRPAAAAPLPSQDEHTAKIQQMEDENFIRSAADQTMPYVQSLITNALRQEFTGAKLSNEAKQAIIQDVVSQIDQLSGHELERWNAIRRSGNVTRAVNFIRARAEAMADRTAREVWKMRYGHLTPSRASAQENGASAPRKTAPTAQGAGTVGNPLRIPSKPPDAEIDRTIPNWQTLLITGTARLRSSGKYVRWTNRTR